MPIELRQNIIWRKPHVADAHPQYSILHYSTQMFVQRMHTLAYYRKTSLFLSSEAFDREQKFSAAHLVVCYGFLFYLMYFWPMLVQQ